MEKILQLRILFVGGNFDLESELFCLVITVDQIVILIKNIPGHITEFHRYIAHILYEHYKAFENT